MDGSPPSPAPLGVDHARGSLLIRDQLVQGDRLLAGLRAFLVPNDRRRAHDVDTTPPDHSWNTKKAPRRSALLAGFVMIGAWANASTKFGFATKQAARQPRKHAKARPMSE